MAPLADKPSLEAETAAPAEIPIVDRKVAAKSRRKNRLYCVTGASLTKNQCYREMSGHGACSSYRAAKAPRHSYRLGRWDRWHRGKPHRYLKAPAPGAAIYDFGCRCFREPDRVASSLAIAGLQAVGKHAAGLGG